MNPKFIEDQFKKEVDEIFSRKDGKRSKVALDIKSSAKEITKLDTLIRALVSSTPNIKPDHVVGLLLCLVVEIGEGCFKTVGSGQAVKAINGQIFRAMSLLRDKAREFDVAEIKERDRLKEKEKETKI